MRANQMSEREVILNPFEERNVERRKRTRTPKTKKRRYWPILLLLVLALIFFLPNLLALSGLHQQAIDFAMGDFQGKILVEKASLGWLQPIQLTNVSAVDSEGKDLFKAEQVTSGNALYSMLNLKDLGRFDILRPTIYLDLQPGGSNLESALAKYLAPAQRPTPSQTTPQRSPGFRSTSSKAGAGDQFDGRSVVASQRPQRDAANGSRCGALVVDVNCTITPMMVDPSGQVTLQAPGKLSISSQIDAGSPDLRFGLVDLILNGDQVPLSVAAPVLQRFIGPAQSAGQFSGELKSTINLDTQSMLMDVGRLEIKGLGLAVPQLIGSDRILLEKLSRMARCNFLRPWYRHQTLNWPATLVESLQTVILT